LPLTGWVVLSNLVHVDCAMLAAQLIWYISNSTWYVEIKCQLEAIEVYVSCLHLQTGHTTLNSTPDQQLENHSTKYHRQQSLCNTLELLMLGIVVPETC